MAIDCIGRDFMCCTVTCVRADHNTWTMNIQGLGILNQIVILITCLTIKMDKGNVVKITVKHNGTGVQGVQTKQAKWAIQTPKLRYETADLVWIGQLVKNDKRLKILPKETITTIRSLRLNRWGKWEGKHIVKDNLIKCINHKNVIYIKTVQSILQHDKFFTLATVNTRSVKGKDQELHQYLTENNIDICTVTETWVSDTDADKLWLLTMDLNNNYKFVPVHRTNGRGGGIGIMYKRHLQMESKCNGQTCSFE